MPSRLDLKIPNPVPIKPKKYECRQLKISNLNTNYQTPISALGGGDQKKVAQSSRESDIVRSGPSADAPALDGYEVVAEYPHVKDSFTQGLWWSHDVRISPKP